MIYGADFSTLEDVERLGGKFYDDGKETDLVRCLAEHGITSARLKLWVDPFGPDGQPYDGGTNDIECLVRLARRAKENGMGIMLDFHYSDFWADPGRQLLPKAWRGMSLDSVCTELREYTLRTLDRLDREKLMPECVQVGNEITNGMLWPLGALTEKSPREGFENLAKLLDAGCRAVREGSDASVMLHLERSGNTPLWTEWLDSITGYGVSFDEIGASYYPYWHGTFEELENNLNYCWHRYGKPFRVVETSYAFTGEHYNPAGEGAMLNLVIGGDFCADGREMPYPASIEGQCAFTRELKRVLTGLDDGCCRGIYWWEPGWLPVKGTNWASTEALRYCHEEEKSTGNEWSNQCMFDYAGNALPVLYEFSKN